MHLRVGHCLIFILATWMTVSTAYIVQDDESNSDRMLVERNHHSGPALTGAKVEEEQEHQLAKRTFLLPLGIMLARAFSGRFSPQQSQPAVVSNIPDDGNPLDFPYLTSSGNSQGRGYPRGSTSNNPNRPAYRRYPRRDRYGNPIYPYNPSGTGYPGIDPLTGLPRTNPYLPGSNPSGNPYLPGTNPYLPGQTGTNPYLPGQAGRNPYLPGQAGSNPYLPGTNPYLPGSNPYLPGSNPYLPGSNPYLPGSNPLLPGTNPLLPGTNPLLPGTNPLLPGTNPLLPGTNPLLPGQPGSNPTNIPPNLLAAINELLPPNSPMMPLLLELLQNPNAQIPAAQSNALGDVLARLIAGLTGPLGKTLSDLLGTGNATPAPGSVPNNLPANPIG